MRHEGDKELLLATPAPVDTDELSLEQRLNVPPDSHKRLKTARFRARAAAALVRTGGVTCGALFTSTRGREVDPGGLPTRLASDVDARPAPALGLW